MGSSETVGEVQACINRVYLGGEQSRAEERRGEELSHTFVISSNSVSSTIGTLVEWEANWVTHSQPVVSWEKTRGEAAFANPPLCIPGI